MDSGVAPGGSGATPVLGAEDEADLADLMAGMFGEVAIAIDGEARGGVAAVVAARRRARQEAEVLANHARVCSPAAAGLPPG